MDLDPAQLRALAATVREGTLDRAARALGGATADRPPALPTAVNADSMNTWAQPALAPLAAEYALDLHREDQEHTSALLRAGAVMAAITSEADPVPGSASSPRRSRPGED